MFTQRYLSQSLDRLLDMGGDIRRGGHAVQVRDRIVEGCGDVQHHAMGTVVGSAWFTLTHARPLSGVAQAPIPS